MPPNFGGRRFVQKLCPGKSGQKMPETAMPPNSGGPCVNSPECLGQKISENAMLPNTVTPPLVVKFVIINENST